MTNREFFTAVAKGNITDEIKTFAVESIAKLDHKNELRKQKPSKTSKANEPIKKAIIELLANGSMVASEIGVALDISTQKASALCIQLVDNGIVEQSEIKIKGKGKVKSYALVKTETETETETVEE